MGITVVGLGPGAPEQMSVAAWRAVEQAGEVYVRTRRHPTVEALPGSPVVHSFDEVYEECAGFAEVYEEIARRVLTLGARPNGVVYCVPGHPLVAETSVLRLLELAPPAGLAVRVVPSESFASPALVALGVAGAELQLVDALGLAQRWHPDLIVDRPALISQLYDRDTASAVKLTLLASYAPEHPVSLVRAAGTRDEAVRTVPLTELDRQTGIDHLTALYVPPRAQPSSLEAFQDTVARLRAPGGCPWDREQDHQSLREALLEETHEVLEAIDNEDWAELRVELGDLLMQICMHAQIASEGGLFGIYDVVAGIDQKIRRRHPHVFGDASVSDSGEVLRNWEEIKRAERGESDSRSLLAGVPGGLPALGQANAYQKRVARVGFDWADADGVWAKLAEEIGELRAAPEDRRQDELGDLLFTVVNLARHLDLDAETALRTTNARFRHRFEAMQALAVERDLDLARLSLPEQDALWDEVKRREA